MGFHYSVKIGINREFDHYRSGSGTYFSLYDQLTNSCYVPFNLDQLHNVISSKWNKNINEIEQITFIFIKRRGNLRSVPKIISLKVENSKVIDKYELATNLKFDRNDPQYENLVHIKLFG